MRNLILIFLIVSGSAKAQLTTAIADSGRLFLNNGVISWTTQDQPNEYKTDTVKVMMFACDTSLGKNEFQTAVYWLNPLTRAEQEHHSVNWIFGYVVRSITIEKAGSHRSGEVMYFLHEDHYSYDTVKYLDDKMQPLSKDIIVWQVK